MNQERTILGIDPGTQMIGWGVIRVTNNRPIFVAMGVVSLKSSKDHFARLGRIFEEISGLIKKFSPTEFAIESPFYGKNVQSMLKLGRAQGIAIAAALGAGLPVCEYAPRKIKLSITGKGASSKEQVSAVVRAILKVEQIPDSYDATDGLAAALCHFLSGSVPLAVRANDKSRKQNGRRKGWKDFLKSNPGRVK